MFYCPQHKGRCNCVTLPRKKLLASNHLLENNYFPSTYLLLNKCFLQEISTLLKLVWSVAFGVSHFHIFMKKWEQPLKGVPLNRCSKRQKRNTEKYLWKSSCSCLFFKMFTKIESYFFLYFRNSRKATLQEHSFFLTKNLNVSETENRAFWTK